MDALEAHRGLQQSCNERTSINTKFNNDDRIPTYTGIMFEIFPKMDLELLTLEIDIRVDRTDKEPDLWVEVYTLLGSYELFKAFTAERWSLVTETNVVLLPEGQGAIIPTSEFTKVEMKAGERRSFYVTFRRSYIDFNVNALQKRGEIQMTTPELDLSVGVGFNEYKFPGDFDRVLDPQFAGVLHLRRSADCSLFVTNTTLTFSYLVEAEPTPEISKQLVEGVQEAITSLMENDSILQSYRQQFGLVQPMQPKSSLSSNNGACPSEWAYCPDRYFHVDLSFDHEDNLNEGELRYQFYRHYAEINAAVEKKVTEHKIVYVGLASVSADITMTLSGTPENSMMDSVQMDYFGQVVVSFLQAQITSTASIFALVIDNQSRSRRTRHARALQGSDLEVTGKLYGAQGTYYSAEDFRLEVENTFRIGQAHFLERLKMNGLRPSDVSEDGRIELFNAITSIGGYVRVDEKPQQSTPGVKSTVTKSTDIGMIVGVVLVLAVVCLLVWLISHFWRLYQYRKEQERIDRLNWQKQIDNEYNEVFGDVNNYHEGENGFAEASLDAARYLDSITESSQELHHQGTSKQLIDPVNQGSVKRSSSLNDAQMSQQRIVPVRSRSCDEKDNDLSQYETARTGGLYKGIAEPWKGQKPQLPKAALDTFLREEGVGFGRGGSSRSVSSTPGSNGAYSGAKLPIRSHSGPVLGYHGPPRQLPPGAHSGPTLPIRSHSGPVLGNHGPPRPPPPGRNGPSHRIPPGKSASGPIPVQYGPPRVGPPLRGPPGRAKSFEPLQPGFHPPPAGSYPRPVVPPHRMAPGRSRSHNSIGLAAARPLPQGVHPRPDVGLPDTSRPIHSQSQNNNGPESFPSGTDNAAPSRMQLMSVNGSDHPPVAPQRPQHTPPTTTHKQIGAQNDQSSQKAESQTGFMVLNSQHNSSMSERGGHGIEKLKKPSGVENNRTSVELKATDRKQVEATGVKGVTTNSLPQGETPPVENATNPADSPNASTASFKSLEKETERKEKKAKKEKKEKKSKKEKKAKKEKKKSKENKSHEAEGTKMKATVKDAV